MDHDVTATADRILDRARVFAVVGASPSPWRPSHGVMRTLLDHGYEVVPVRPGVEEILGQRAYPDLASIPAEVEVDVVDVFRRSERAGVHVDEAIARGVGAAWLQLGVIDEAAATRARAAGLDVVMDRCPAIELRRRGGIGRRP
ncbi:MAG: CoA-binding protein [Nitriliruptoraceae bacterium]